MGQLQELKSYWGKSLKGGWQRESFRFGIQTLHKASVHPEPLVCRLTTSHAAKVAGSEQRFGLHPIVERGRVWSLSPIKLTAYKNKKTNKQKINNCRGT